MSANSFGHLFVISTFGESHGPGLGCLIDGCPAGVAFDRGLLDHWMNRRRPGQSAVTSARQESDTVEILSGVFQERTLGTPIMALVRNHDARSGDYELLKTVPRPGHATDLWQEKFGHSDPRGSGRASGRETVGRVIGAAFAQMFLRRQCPALKIFGFVSRVGPWALNKRQVREAVDLLQGDPSQIEKYATRVPHPDLNATVEAQLIQAKEQGESYGAQVQLIISGLPAALGQPVFHKLKADFGAAFLSVGATSAVEIGEGTTAAYVRGSEFHAEGEYGGLRGGISTGEAIHIAVSLKPTSSLGVVAKAGRHDPCIAPRALIVLEAMTNLVVADHILWRRLDRME